jgi:hypothetical protein
VGELLRDPDDPRRRGVRWEDIDLEDGSMDVYRKKQQWDAASLPDPVISPLRSYRKLMDSPTKRWPVFATFDQRTLAELVHEELADRGAHPDVIEERREEYTRDLLLALDENIRPPSISTDGARSILQRLSEAAEIDIDHPKHDHQPDHCEKRLATLTHSVGDIEFLLLLVEYAEAAPRHGSGIEDSVDHFIF